jgi:hypothetical protein
MTEDAVVERIHVEVFPIEPDRWIAVIETPRGPFSTEARSPEQPEPKAREAIATVLGRTQVDLDFADDLGGPWSPSGAEAQAARLLAR